MLFNLTSIQIGTQPLLIELVDEQGLISDYNFNVEVIDKFEFTSLENNKIVLKYPKQKLFNISNLFTQLEDHKVSVFIKEKNKEVEWLNYNSLYQIIQVSNITKDDSGVHYLLVYIFDYWYLRYFNTSIILDIRFPRPPIAVGTISNITVYQGQIHAELIIKEGIFYDEDDSFSIIINCWNNVRIISEVSLSSFSSINSQTLLILTFNKKFIGIWPSSLIAADSFLQTASINFFINVLKWPQRNWLYWNGPDTIDWTEWIRGYTVNSQSGEWMMAKFYFDKWIIIAYTIIVLLMTIFTDQDLNASYILLESMTLYWILFIVFENRTWYIKQYLSEIFVIITHLNSLIFPYFDWLTNINSDSQISDSFLFNWGSILIIIGIFILSQVCKKNIANSRRLSFIFRIGIFSKYMYWASTYMIFWMLYEIAFIDSFISSRVLLLILSIVFMWFFLSSIYWLVIYPFQKWCIWSRYEQINLIRENFRLLENLKQIDYILIIRNNLIRKLIFWIMIIIQIKMKLTPLIFTFLMISTQTLYSNLTIGLYQFSSFITRGLITFNEIWMVGVVLISSIEYLNETFETNSDLIKLIDIWICLIRFHILSIICVELARIFWFVVKTSISIIRKKRQASINQQ